MRRAPQRHKRAPLINNKLDFLGPFFPLFCVDMLPRCAYEAKTQSKKRRLHPSYLVVLLCQLLQLLSLPHQHLHSMAAARHLMPYTPEHHGMHSLGCQPNAGHQLKVAPYGLLNGLPT